MTADGNMEYIRGITFAPFAQRGVLAQERTRESLRMMKERTGADTVLLAPGGLQKTAQSVEICYDTKDTMSDTELTDFIRYAKRLGLKVFLKPTVNCVNGTWRHISISSMRMCPVSRNGPSGSLLITNSSSITQRSRRKQAVRCLSRAVRWSWRSAGKRSGES